MPTIPTGQMERELRALYLRWLAGLSYDDPHISIKVKEFQDKSQALIEKMGGRTASLGALADFPAPKLLDLSPHIGTIYSDIEQAAIQAGILAGLQSTDVARQMFNAGVGKSYRRLERLARTETTNAYWQNAFNSIADLPALVMVWGSEDGPRTCAWCRERDGLVIAGTAVRDHPNGRCTPIPTLRSRVRYRGSVRADGEMFYDGSWGKPATPQKEASLEGRDPRSMTAEERIRATEIMYGTGSPQHRKAQATFKDKPAAKAPAVKQEMKVLSPEEIRTGTTAAEAQRVALEKAKYAGGSYNEAKGYTNAAAKALGSYTEGGAAEMNALLRNPVAYAAQPGYDDFFAELFAQQIEDLTGLLAKNKLTQDIVVARGVTVAPGFNPATMKAGDYFADPAFLSTTSNMAEAMDFAAGRGAGAQGWTFITKAPKGTNAVAGADYQNEIIFKPGQMQRVVGVDTKARIIYTEMTP